jgi:hypothetical protein
LSLNNLLFFPFRQKSKMLFLDTVANVLGFLVSTADPQ